MTSPRTGRSGELSYETLKSRQRTLREGFPDGVGLRVHRAISWLQRNAAYADELRDSEAVKERSVFDGFFSKLTDLDKDLRIYNTIWERYPGEIRVLLDNH